MFIGQGGFFDKKNFLKRKTPRTFKKRRFLLKFDVREKFGEKVVSRGHIFKKTGFRVQIFQLNFGSA
jgi:hypothetical protein